MLDTDPVVVRRTMAGLQRASYLSSGTRHGGGWALARSHDDVTLDDIHEALGGPKVLAIGLADDNPQCLVERDVDQALKAAKAEAEQRLLSRFREVTIGALARNIAFRSGIRRTCP